MEYIQYLRNPGSAFAQKLGYSKELIAIEARYQRNTQQWQTHITNTQQFIQQAGDSCAEKHTAVILGAGLLFDIPLDYLASSFKTVCLIDVVFASYTKNLTRKYSNVHLVEHDLNGLAELSNKHKSISTAPSVNAALPQDLPLPNFIVSANILSQLHLAPVAYLAKHSKLKEVELERFAQKILQSHIELLRNYQDSNICLVTDYLRFTTDKKGEQQQEHALLGLELPAPSKSWHWEFAPRGELRKGLSQSTLVFAYNNF